MRLYFDHNATTPVAPEVLEAIMPFLCEEYGNASSIHRLGQRARAAVERARGQVAALIHCEPNEIVFTSGGTESDNLAILGVARASSLPKKHVIASAIEHHAVLRSCQALEREGMAVTYLPVSAEGFVEPEQVRKALRPETVLISIMHANNEVGAVQPLAEIAAIAREAGILFHTDAVQSTGKIPVDVKRLGADLLSLSAHKLYGPKGVGALYVRQGVSLQPVLFGGHKEMDPRPGTENVAAIVGLGAAAELAARTLPQESQRLATLRDRLESGILDRITDAGVNGPTQSFRDGEFLRTPNTTNLYFDFIEGEALVIALDLRGIACSTGSACTSGAVEPSHVLTALGLPPERARASIR
ncbi:MAG: cysteine desulfurase, partial [Acidobacteria bacterium]|nr:cysteine desulfurase [Acidobacteriota bacterium]